MAAYLMVCILFVAGALTVYALILLKKKQDSKKISDIRNGSLTIAWLFPMPQQSNNLASSSSPSSDETIAEEVSTSPSPPEAIANGGPASSPPPPPPPPPPILASFPANGPAPPGQAGKDGKRMSIVSISAMIPPPKKAVALTTTSPWHDKQMDIVDKIFLVVFPLLFVAFNCLYWPMMINYREYFGDVEGGEEGLEVEVE